MHLMLYTQTNSALLYTHN